MPPLTNLTPRTSKVPQRKSLSRRLGVEKRSRGVRNDLGLMKLRTRQSQGPPRRKGVESIISLPREMARRNEFYFNWLDNTRTEHHYTACCIIVYYTPHETSEPLLQDVYIYVLLS